MKRGSGCGRRVEEGGCAGNIELKSIKMYNSIINTAIAVIHNLCRSNLKPT